VVPSGRETQPPKTLYEWRKIGAALRGQPHRPDLGTPTGTAAFSYPLYGPSGAADTDKSSAIMWLPQLAGHVEAVPSVIDVVSEGTPGDEAALCWDDTSNKPRLPLGRSLLYAVPSSSHLQASPAQPGQDQDEKGEPMLSGLGHFVYPDGPSGKTPT